RNREAAADFDAFGAALDHEIRRDHDARGGNVRGEEVLAPDRDLRGIAARDAATAAEHELAVARRERTFDIEVLRIVRGRGDVAVVQLESGGRDFRGETGEFERARELRRGGRAGEAVVRGERALDVRNFGAQQFDECKAADRKST